MIFFIGKEINIFKVTYNLILNIDLPLDRVIAAFNKYFKQANSSTDFVTLSYLPKTLFLQIVQLKDKLKEKILNLSLLFSIFTMVHCGPFCDIHGAISCCWFLSWVLSALSCWPILQDFNSKQILIVSWKRLFLFTGKTFLSASLRSMRKKATAFILLIENNDSQNNYLTYQLNCLAEKLNSKNNIN